MYEMFEKQQDSKEWIGEDWWEESGKWDREKDFGFHPKCDAKSSESSEMIYVLKDHPGESVENRIRQVQEVEQA